MPRISYCLKAILLRSLAFAIGISTGFQSAVMASPQRHLEAARAGSADDMYTLGQLHDLGLGVERDHVQAMTWYLAAAQKGHADAAFQIGYAHYWGRDLPKDWSKAHTWFVRAAENGSRKAIPYLSKMYALGEGVARDRQISQRWSQRLLALKAQDHQKTSDPRRTEEARATPETAVTEDRSLTPDTSLEIETELALAETGTSSRQDPALMHHIAQNQWEENNQPALYLSSVNTRCTQHEKNLNCLSRRLSGELSGVPYFFAISSNLKDFTATGRFTLRFSAHFIAPKAKLPKQAFSELESEVNAQGDQLACKLSREGIECLGSNGKRYRFRKASTPALVEGAGSVGSQQVPQQHHGHSRDRQG